MSSAVYFDASRGGGGGADRDGGFFRGGAFVPDSLS